MLIRVEPSPTILSHPLQPPARMLAIIRSSRSSTQASSRLSILSREGIEIILSRRGKVTSPLACLLSALNPFLPRASDESAKRSAYRADRNYRARSAGLVPSLKRFLPSHGCASRDAHTAAMRGRCVCVFCSRVGPRGRLLVLRVFHMGERELGLRATTALLFLP